jgi:hypothetical protein
MGKANTYPEMALADVTFGLSTLAVDDDDTATTADGDVEYISLAHTRQFEVRYRWLFTIADDSVGTLVFPSDYGNALHVFKQGNIYSKGMAVARATTFWMQPSAGFIGNANTTVGTAAAFIQNTALTGTSGVDGEITHSVTSSDRTLHVENRIGQTDDQTFYFSRDPMRWIE